MTRTTVVAVCAVALGVADPASLAKPAPQRERAALRGQITVRATETLTGSDVTDGGVAGRGRFRISGAITDKGKVTDFRTVKGGTAVLRRVAAGARGTITFLITIHLGGPGPETWRITSATRAYKRLHGRGRQVVDNFDQTPARFVLQGTVSQ
jgi:hypothetical protein